MQQNIVRGNALALDVGVDNRREGGFMDGKVGVIYWASDYIVYSHYARKL
jgi:hypothetical protein